MTREPASASIGAFQYRRGDAARGGTSQCAEINYWKGEAILQGLSLLANASIRGHRTELGQNVLGYREIPGVCHDPIGVDMKIIAYFGVGV